ncbi:Wzz/FepE/Etk N-terminal domain-containing protein [Amylibacter sp.]|nr:Wzz/FepE/Etk N-terminal domain-containing protein [Amylibacter sp.]
MNQNVDINDETDLKEIFLKFWRYKIYIFISIVICITLASFYLRNTEREYTVEYRLKPVSETKNSTSMAGLGGIASLAGIQLPSNSSTDFNIFKQLITSVEASEIIFKNANIIKNIFKSEWNRSLEIFSAPTPSKFQILTNNFKGLLTGNKNAEYIPPNARRLSAIIQQNIQVKEDKETGFLKITSETSNPELMLLLIVEVTEASDKIMRQRYVEFSTNPLTFYKDKLRTARSREHRESLASLISAEEQKLMFASRGKYFIAEPYLSPSISLFPTAPNPKFVLILSLVLGLLLGSAVVLIRTSIMKEN